MGWQRIAGNPTPGSTWEGRKGRDESGDPSGISSAALGPSLGTRSE